MTHLQSLAAFHRSLSRGAGPLERLGVMLAVWRQRRILSDLPRERLTDLGISAAEAETEAARPLWDVPDHWLQR